MRRIDGDLILLACILCAGIADTFKDDNPWVSIGGLFLLTGILRYLMRFAVREQNSWPTVVVIPFAVYILYMIFYFCEKFRLI